MAWRNIEIDQLIIAEVLARGRQVPDEHDPPTRRWGNPGDQTNPDPKHDALRLVREKRAGHRNPSYRGRWIPCTAGTTRAHAQRGLRVAEPVIGSDGSYRVQNRSVSHCSSSDAFRRGWGSGRCGRSFHRRRDPVDAAGLESRELE
jgi:hypothetical protein